MKATRTRNFIAKALFAALLVVGCAGLISAAAPAAHAAVFIRVGFAPPPIPVYEQPMVPGDGYMWTPGYWAWDGGQYTWVDGAWVYPPYAGALWTPGFWGWGDGFYFWHAGYWGRTVGYYGGINYGFGYFGTGFFGGYWGGGHFFYNTAYVRGAEHFHNVYNRPTGGFGPHPGGQSFARTNGHEDFNRGAGINGHEAPGAHNVGNNARGFTGNNNAGAHNNVAPVNNGFHGNPAPANNGGQFHGGNAPAPSGGQFHGGGAPSGGGAPHAAPAGGGGRPSGGGGGGGHRR